MAKIISVRVAALIFALAIVLCGCTPAGPRALLKGKRFLDRGDFAAAVAQFQKATTLLTTNASAWNYYGVALQREGQLDDAATAYLRALELNRDLTEAHFNLGSLRLEQNNAEAAKTEFTAYTLRRNNDAAGWLKLGAAQLKLGEVVAAERSFSTVLALKPNDAEAFNGLGRARIQRGIPQEAVRFFAEAKKQNPNFAPAILNLATTSQQYLHDNKAALENYRAYLALTPRAANWDEVNALANGLEFTPASVAVLPPAQIVKNVSPVPETKVPPKISTVIVQHSFTNRPEPVVKASQPRSPQFRITANNVNTAPIQVVSVPPPQKIVTAPPIAPKATEVVAAPVEIPIPEEETPRKSGFFHRLFGSSKKESAPNAKFIEQGVTPLPGPPPENHAVARPSDAAMAPVSVSRYNYLSPAKPASGNRASANGAFTRARVFEQDEKWLDALQWYQQAAQFDPSWYEAQYNTGVLAHQLRNYSLALPSYEYALAIQPDSADARYNFALALKAAGYATDSADQFKKMIAQDPRDARAHLALANLYAQSLRDPTQARQHYLKVLELDPSNAQAADIRFWLSANGK